MISTYRFKNMCYLSSLVHLNMYIYKHMYIISEYVYIMYVRKYITHKIYLTYSEISVVIAQINYVKSSTNYWRKRIFFRNWMQSKNYKSSIGNTLDLNFGATINIANLMLKHFISTLNLITLRIFSNNYRAQKWSFLRIWSHLLKKSLMENFILCARLCNLSSNPETFHKASKH